MPGLAAPLLDPLRSRCDVVLRGTDYEGSAATRFAKLTADGWGFISLLEAGYPIPGGAIKRPICIDTGIPTAFSSVPFLQQRYSRDQCFSDNSRRRIP